MFTEWLAAPVPLWLLLVLGVFLFVLGIAVNRKFSFTSGWLAILGTLFTTSDIKALAILIWRANIIPAAMKDLRFGGNETAFANYFADMVLKFLPEIGKVEEVINGMTAALPKDFLTRGFRGVGVYEKGLHLEGRGFIQFLEPMPGRDTRPGWPLIDKAVAPPAGIDAPG